MPGWVGVWASDNGQIWQDEVPGMNVRRPGLRRQTSTRAGYMRVTAVNHNGPVLQSYPESVHVLVATAFYGPRPSSGHVPDHLDNNPSNNRADNLEWVTISENRRRAWNYQLGTTERKGKPVCQNCGYARSSHGPAGACRIPETLPYRIEGTYTPPLRSWR